MIPAKSLVRLYPYAMRDRWGGGLEAEVVAGGWRAVPNLVAGALALWLHPVVWPAGSPDQRRGRAAVMAFVIALTGWLLGHVLVETGPAPRRLAHSWPLTVSDLLVVAGLVLVVPRPRLAGPALSRLVRRGLRRLTVPAVAGAGVVVWANLGSGGAAPVTRHVVLTMWWAVLVTGVVQACRLIADLDRESAEPPPLSRLRLGLWVLVVALAGGGAVVLGSAAGAGAAAFGAVLILLTLGCFVTLRDLYECR